MPNRYTPVKDPVDSVTEFGVERRTYPDGTVKYRFTDTPSGKATWIIRESITNRWGFDPEDGEVIYPEKVPDEFKERLGLGPNKEPGDETVVSEGLREAADSSPAVEAEHSDFQTVEAEKSKTPEKEGETSTGDARREIPPTLEASKQSTPKGNPRSEEDSLHEELENLEEWRLWAIGAQAELAGVERPSDAVLYIRPENLRMWEKMKCLEDSQMEELKFLLKPRRLDASGGASEHVHLGSDFEAEGDEKDQEEKLSTLRIVSDDMVEIYIRSVDFMEEVLQLTRTRKRPSVDPSQVALLPFALRRYSNSVKLGYYELDKIIGSNDPDMKKARSQINTVYNNKRKSLNRLMLRFLKVLVEVAIPHIEHSYQVKLGLKPDPLESVDLNSVLSEAVSFDSSWAPEKDSYYEFSLEGTSSFPRRSELVKGGYLSSTRAKDAPTLVLGTPHRDNMQDHAQASATAKDRSGRDKETQKAIDDIVAQESSRKSTEMGYIISSLEKKRKELEGIRAELAQGKDSFGHTHTQTVIEQLKTVKQSLKEEIRDMEDDLRKMQRGEENFGASSFSSPIKYKSKDRRVTIDTDKNQRVILDIDKNQNPRGRLLKDKTGIPSRYVRSPNRSLFPQDLSLYDETEHEAMSGGQGMLYYDSDGRPRRRRPGYGSYKSNKYGNNREDWRDQERDTRKAQGRGSQSDREGSQHRRENQGNRRHQNQDREHQRHEDRNEDRTNRSDRDESSRRRKGDSGRKKSRNNQGDDSDDSSQDRQQNRGGSNNGGNRREQPRDNRRGGRENGSPSSSPGSSDSSDSGGGDDRRRRGNDRRGDDRRRDQGQGQGPGPGQGQVFYMIDRTGQPSPDEKAAQREILEGFLDEDDMKRFYKRLPVPWNVVPQPVGKKQEITKMIQMTIRPEDHFTGETESGTYLEWRILVINRIHSKPLSITDKIHLLGSTVKQSDENLRQIFKTGVHNPRTYQRIIRSLEGHYGGKERTYAYLRYQMLSMSRFSLKDLRNVSIARAKVEKFIEHVGVHQVGGAQTEENRTLLSIFLSSVLTESQVLKYRTETQEMGIGDGQIFSLQTLADWLGWKEENLEWTKMNYNPMVMGIHRKSKTKEPAPSTHKVLLSGECGASRATTCAAQGFSPSNSKGKASAKPQKAKNSRVALVANDKSGETTEEEEKDSHGESDDKSEDPSDGDDSGKESGNEQDEEGETDGDVALAAAADVRLPMCSYCKTSRHKLHTCEEFLKLTVKERYKYVEKDKRCANCLSPKHKSKKCNSTFKCRHCDGKHHSTLCFKNPELLVDKEKR